MQLDPAAASPGVKAQLQHALQRGRGREHQINSLVIERESSYGTQPGPSIAWGKRHTSSTLSSADERVSSELMASSAMAQRGPHIGTFASHRGSSLLCRPTAHPLKIEARFPNT